MTKRGWAILLGSLLVLLGCGDEEQGPRTTLEGTWDLIAYSDHGRASTVSGSAVFGRAGDFAINGEITFPGEPTDTVRVSGTWSVTGDRATLTTSEGTGEWVVGFSGAEATMTLVGPEPTSVIGLRRE